MSTMIVDVVWCLVSSGFWSTLALLAWSAFTPAYQWRMRHVPGLPHVPFLGSLGLFLKSDRTLEVHKLYMKYTTAFKAWLGFIPLLYVKDLQVARQIALKFKSRPDFSHLSVRYGRAREIWEKLLLFINTESQVRPIRKVFEASVLQPAALAAQAPFVTQATSRLVERIAKVANSGEPIDFLPAAGDLTMDVISMSAFGLDLKATEQACTHGSTHDYVLATEPSWWTKYKPGSHEFGARMAATARAIMNSVDPAHASVYNMLGLLLMPFLPLWRLLAQYLPDHNKKKEIQALLAMDAAIQLLIDDWRLRKACTACTADGGDAAEVPPVDAAAIQPAAISDSGFLARLLSGRDLDNGEAFDDTNIIAQVQMFLLAGYDTTANTMAMALHLLAQHPEQQRKLQQELDMHLQGRSPGIEDLEHLPYCCAVVDETMRLHPTGPTLHRINPHGYTDVGQGIRAPPKTTMVIPVYCFHRDPAIWPSATEFLPERWLPGHKHLAPSNPQAFMPFGLGGRMCIGYKLALLETRIAVARLLQRFNVAPAPGAPPLRLHTTLVFKPMRVDLVFTPRNDDPMRAAMLREP